MELLRGWIETGVIAQSGQIWELVTQDAPPLPSVLEVIRAAAGSINRYPDMAVTELTQALADTLGVPVEHVATDGCGAPLLSTSLTGLARAFAREKVRADDRVIVLPQWNADALPPASTRRGA